MSNQNYGSFTIIPDGTFGNYSVRKVGKGPLPTSLSGSFTSILEIKQRIDRFMKKKEQASADKQSKAGSSSSN